MLKHYFKATINAIKHEVSANLQLKDPFRLKYNYRQILLNEGQTLLTPYQKECITRTGKLTLFN